MGQGMTWGLLGRQVIPWPVTSEAIAKFISENHRASNFPMGKDNSVPGMTWRSYIPESFQPQRTTEKDQRIVIFIFPMSMLRPKLPRPP